MILDVEVTTGEVNEGQVVLERLDAVAAVTGGSIDTVTADASLTPTAQGLRGPGGAPDHRRDPHQEPAPGPDPGPSRSARRSRSGGSATTRATTSSDARGARSCGRTTRRSPTAGSSPPRRGTAKAATSPRCARRRRVPPGRSSSSTTTPPSCGPDVGATAGASRTIGSISATAGGPKASTARPRPGPRSRPRRAPRAGQHAHPGGPGRRRDHLKRLAAALLALICALLGLQSGPIRT